MGAIVDRLGDGDSDVRNTSVQALVELATLGKSVCWMMAQKLIVH